MSKTVLLKPTLLLESEELVNSNIKWIIQDMIWSLNVQGNQIPFYCLWRLMCVCVIFFKEWMKLIGFSTLLLDTFWFYFCRFGKITYLEVLGRHFKNSEVTTYLLSRYLPNFKHKRNEKMIPFWVSSKGLNYFCQTDSDWKETIILHL